MSRARRQAAFRPVRRRGRAATRRDKRRKPFRRPPSAFWTDTLRAVRFQFPYRAGIRKRAHRRRAPHAHPRRSEQSAPRRGRPRRPPRARAAFEAAASAHRFQYSARRSPRPRGRKPVLRARMRTRPVDRFRPFRARFRFHPAAKPRGPQAARRSRPSNSRKRRIGRAAPPRRRRFPPQTARKRPSFPSRPGYPQHIRIRTKPCPAPSARRFPPRRAG